MPSIDKPRHVLWNVIEVKKGVVGALANSNIAARKGGEAVFFDILSISLVIQLGTFLTISIVLLTLRPLLILLLAAIVHFAKHEDRVDRNTSSHHHRNHHRDSRSVSPTRKDREHPTRAEIRKRVIRKLNIAWMWVKFLVAVVSAMGALRMLVVVFDKMNPYAYHASSIPILVFANIFCLFNLTLVLRFPPSPVAEKQKHAVLMYIELAILARHQRNREGEGDRVVRFQEALDDIDEDIAIDTGSVFERESEREREEVTERTPLILRFALVDRKDYGEEGVVSRLVGLVQPEGYSIFMYAGKGGGSSWTLVACYI
ncbi:hypothetical protein BDQ17DRAFT_1334960 [Cyathus striatus]|nr:hypothetical protein BDQ17DRAFT_1334960 [Cyathus striatus]